MSTTSIRHKASRLRALLMVLALLASAFTATTATVAATEQPAAAAPNLQMPFPCGQTWHANTYPGHYNNAIDWWLWPAAGKTVVAAGAETATAKYYSTYGNYVDIDHGGGYVTRYAHLQSPGVSGTVAQGQAIGKVGDTGSPGNYHLHFEVIYNGTGVSPMVLGGVTITPSNQQSATTSSPTYTSKNGCGSGGSGWSVGGATYKGTQLSAGQTLLKGQYLASGNLQYALVFQSDGNLVLYRAGKALWNSKTAGSGADRLVMQGDGNLVLYDGGTARWHTRTSGTGASRAVLQSDGNLVVYAGSSAKWNSGTGGHANYTYFGADRLTRGQQMGINRYIRSADGRYALLLQSDGNLVLYSAGYHVIWHTKTGGSGADRLVMQGDGNLVLYDGGTARWHTRTSGTNADRAIVQSDGNFVVYAGSSARWNSGTSGKI